MVGRATGVRWQESASGRRHRARTLAAFFAAGALLSTVVIMLPGGEGMDRPAIAVTAAVAGAGALGLRLLAASVGRVACHACVVGGTVLIAACQVLAGGGSPTAMYSMLFVWVALHCALFFRPPAIAVHLTLTTVAQAAAMTWLGGSEWLLPQLATTLVTQGAAVLVVGSLATRLRHQAGTDALTGLANRRSAAQALEGAFDRSRRRGGDVCVAMLDLDGFKAYNDRHGHAGGDLALVEIAERWRRLAQRDDTLARTGGDEFLLVLPGCDADDGARIVAQLTSELPEGVSCSAGVACWDGTETRGGLVARADAALYRAKREGHLVVATAGYASVPDRRGAGASRPTTATVTGRATSTSSTST